MDGLKDIAADIILISENLQAVIEAINGRLDNLYMRVEALEKKDMETPPIQQMHIYSPELIKEIKEEPEPKPEPKREEPEPPKPEPPKAEPKKEEPEEPKTSDNIDINPLQD